MGEVINMPQQRVSKAALAFAPIVSQHDLDAEALTERCAALTRKIRPRFVVFALVFAFLGWWAVAAYFAVFAIFTRTIVNSVTR